MIWRNLWRRKGRTLLTVLGISIGVAAIVALGALANGLGAGYDALLRGSEADLVLSQPNTFDLSMSALEESIADELLAMPEVAEVSGMLQGIVEAEGVPYFFLFGYPENGFPLKRFRIIEGHDLHSREARAARAKVIILGSAAAKSLKKDVGDSVRLMESVYRVIGIYETGSTLEDGGAVLDLADAQALLGKTHQVSAIYIQLDDLRDSDRLAARVARLWPRLSLGGVDAVLEDQAMANMMDAFVWAIAGLAILIGSVGTMNAHLMSVFERTREIGVLRAVGWNRRRVMRMILAESLVISLLGGIVGSGLGWALLLGFSDAISFWGGDASAIGPELLLQAAVVVLGLGIVGGLYPAWRAANLEPIEALRYEGGSGGTVHRLPIGGMALQSLWQRSGRTLLTLVAVGITVGAIMALEGVILGVTDAMSSLSVGTESQIMIRQEGVGDTAYSTLDERLADRIAAMSEVQATDGLIFTAVMLEDAGTWFILFGYDPRGYGIQRFSVVDGKRLVSNNQILLGRMMADALNKNVGDMVALSGTRFRVVGIYESGTGWEEMGGVITLRAAQTLTGKARKVSLIGVRLHDPRQAEAITARINDQLEGAYAALSGEFVDQLPDMATMDVMINGISLMAILVGGVGVMNTMLMAVLERTREIGVLRALGWRRRAVLGLILKEATWVGLLGGAVGVFIALSLGWMLGNVPLFGEMVTPIWQWQAFARALSIALLLGIVGGLYPAYRATHLQPVEALRYE